MTGALLLAALLLAPASRAAPAGPLPPASGPVERARRLEVALGMLHGRASAALWRSVGAEAVPELSRLARDPAALPSRRAKAIEGLAILGGADAAAVVSDLAGREGPPFSVRAAALAGAGLLRSPAGLAGLLGPVLQSATHPAVRAVAAEVLAERAPATACAAVRARAAREAAADRPGFGRALARCDAQGR